MNDNTSNFLAAIDNLSNIIEALQTERDQLMEEVAGLKGLTPTAFVHPYPEQMVRYLDEAKNKIEAVKMLRSFTHWGLLESKNFVEVNCKWDKAKVISEESEIVYEKDIVLPSEIARKVNKLIEEGKKIDAIRELRMAGEGGINLFQANWLVENIGSSFMGSIPIGVPKDPKPETPHID